MPLPLDVLADLQLAVDGEEISIRGDGDRLVVDLPSLRAGRRLLQSGPFALETEPTPVTQLHEVLGGAGVSVEVRLQGDPIARMGAGAEPGLLSRALNLGAVELRPTRSVLRAMQRRPVLTAAVIAGLVVLLGWMVRRLGGD